jgi:Holliday junction resolvasome RuvABC endonuclease subunit
MLLALDISSASTGYAVFDQNDRSLISYGTLRLPDKEWFVRGHKFYDWLTTTIKSYNITHIIAEDCFSGKNANTFKVLARLQAMAGLAASKANIYTVFIMQSALRFLLGEGTGLMFNFNTIRYNIKGGK